jgi:hypothetical protein
LGSQCDAKYRLLPQKWFGLYYIAPKGSEQQHQQQIEIAGAPKNHCFTLVVAQHKMLCMLSDKEGTDMFCQVE